jgi:outer membrane protein assembly factor BamB
MIFLMVLLVGDVIHTRDGHTVEGRILDYESYIDVEPDPQPGKPLPKPVRILRRDILKIDLAPDFIRYPDLMPFPFEEIERADYKYFGAGGMILCLPQPPARKVFAVDLRAAKKVWELELPNRIGEPVVGGRTVYFCQREKDVDDTKKIKINGTPFSKDVHKLIVTAADLSTGQVLWKQVFDNNDRKDQLWEYIETVPPSLHFLPDRLVIRTLKLGWPMDAAANVDKKSSQRYVSFISFDPAEKKVLVRTDSSDASEYGGYPYFSGDSILTQVGLGTGRWKLCNVAMNTGRLRWQTDPIPQGRIFDVTDDFAYVAEGPTLYAYAVKTGKKDDKWSIDATGGTISAVDLNYVYLYRTKRSPRAIVGFDTRKGTEGWKIDMPDGEDYAHLMLAGHRLLYTTKGNSIACFDTLAKKELWRWAAPLQNPVLFPRVMGSALSFYKDGRLVLLDLDTGRKIWEVRQPYQTILQSGDGGIMGKQLQGHDLLRERPLPKGATFLTPTGTPLRFVLGDDAWSVPAVEKGILTSMSTGGQLASLDLKTRELLWIQKVTTQTVSPLTAPIVHEKGIAVFAGGDTLLFDPEAKTKRSAVRHLPLRPDRQGEVTPLGMLAVAPTGVSMVNLSTGEKAWDTPLHGVGAYGVFGGQAFVQTSQNLQILDLKTGAAGDALAIPRSASLIATDGKTIWAASGPFGLFEMSSESEYKSLFKPQRQDQKMVLKGFRGALAAGDGAVFYSHADGELSRFEPGAEKPTWTYETPGMTSSLLVHGGRLWFAAWGKGLYGLNLKTGVLEWNREGIRDANLFTPILWEGKPAFWSTDGWLVTSP